MDKPTLQEVKERFKNAKEVKCLAMEENRLINYKVEHLNEFSEWKLGNYWLGNENYNVLAYTDGKYAEIISYKEPLYQLTAKEVVHAYENPQWFKDTFKECFETEFLNKWATSLNEYEGKCLGFINNDKDLSNVGYGIDYRGEWVNRFDISSSGFKKLRLATEKEVEEALVKEAIKRGYEVGNYKLISGYYGIETNKEYVFIKNTLYFNGDVIFHNGQWAEILNTYTIPEAEEKFNIKIKAV